MSVDEDLTCENPFGTIESYCPVGHVIEWNLRCRKCGPCFNHRKREWAAKLMWRWIHNADNVKRVYLWTLGTNWDESEEHELQLKRAWTLFRKRVNINQKRKVWKGRWRPLLYVFEVGSTGKKLHIHVVAWGYLDQELGRNLWSELVGISDPNFGYSPPRNRDPLKGSLYLGKYLSKDIGKNWYWMGQMLKKVPERPAAMCSSENCIELIYKYNIRIGDYQDKYYKLYETYLGDGPTLAGSNYEDQTYEFTVLPR